MKFRSKDGRFIISEGNDVFYVGDDFSKALSVMNSKLPDLDDEFNSDLDVDNLDDDNFNESDLFDELCDFSLED